MAGDKPEADGAKPEPVLPPEEFRNRPFHQLRADVSGVIERMQWLTHEQAVSTGYLSDKSEPDVGYWVRTTTPFGATEMAAVGWRYLRPCDASTPRVTWEE